jgi:hypothetical protein
MTDPPGRMPPPTLRWAQQVRAVLNLLGWYVVALLEFVVILVLIVGPWVLLAHYILGGPL